MMASARGPRKSAPAPREAQVAERVHAGAIHLLRRLRRADEATGLSAPRLSALSVVVFAGPLPLGALAAAEQVRPPTMTRLVAALEGEGLVRRVADASDARRALVEATPRGRRLMMAGRGRRIALLAEQLAGIPAEELDALERAAATLERIARAEPTGSLRTGKGRR